MDLAALMTDMERFGFRRASHTTRLPKPRITLAELQPTEFRESLATLPDWELVVSDDPGREPRQRTELRKSFEFKSFEFAMRFMSSAAEHIARKQHHPRWENVWRTVTIWPSTWDIGSKPSKLDLELARYFDELFARLERDA